MANDPDRGFSLIELVVAQGALALLVLIAASALITLKQQSDGVVNSAQGLADRELFKLQLQSTVNQGLLQDVWINPQIATALQIPWTDGAAPVTGTHGSVIALPGQVVRGGALVADASGKFDAVIFIQKAKQATIVTLDSSGQPDPGYELSPAQTTATFNVIGSATALNVGDIVALYASGGLQFARISGTTLSSISLDWSSFGTFQIGAAMQTWPSLYLTPGVLIHPVQVSMLAQDASTGFATLWKIDPSTGAFSMIGNLPHPLTSLQIKDPGGAEPAPSYLRLHASAYSVYATARLSQGSLTVTINAAEPL